jgi:hypothetical protein
MPDAAPAPSWKVLLAPKWLAWHLFAVVAIVGMLWLGDWQFRRAMAGNTLSWAYTFEWPIFAVFGVVFWVKTVRDELHPAPAGAGQPEEISLPGGVPAGTSAPAGGHDGDGAGAGATDEAAAGPQDPELAEYNAYLAKLSSQVKGHGRWHGLR